METEVDIYGPLVLHLIIAPFFSSQRNNLTPQAFSLYYISIITHDNSLAVYAIFCDQISLV